jgi:CheY-like chemotaxis protein
MSDDGGDDPGRRRRPENVRLLEAVLERRGYDVVSATDGRSRSSSSASGEPDSSCSTS